MKEKIILALASPRRKELLKMLGIPFFAVESLLPEPEVEDENMVEEIALAKARSVSFHLVKGGD